MKLLLLLLAIGALLYMGSGCQQAESAQQELTWIAPLEYFNNPESGPCVEYVVVWSTDSVAITMANASLFQGWQPYPGVTIVPLIKTPAAPGTLESWDLSGLPEGIIFYASIKSKNSDGYFSAMGTIPKFRLPVRPETTNLNQPGE